MNRLTVALGIGAVLLASAQAATNPHVAVSPQVRIVDVIDNAKLVAIPNSHAAAVDGLADQGRVAASTPVSHLMLVLKGSDMQEFTLRGLLDDQQDKGSPNYHQWMTPEGFGAAFGVASADVARITAWLQDAGFSVDQVAKNARVISFSGTTGQVETAFHTEFHHVTVNGEAHIASTMDLSVPAALSPVIAGIASLSDFRAKANAVNPRKLVMGTDGNYYNVIPGTNSPDYTSLSSGSHYVGPADVATIYNAKPLLATGINGRGVTIGILGQSSINLSNVETFRSLFQLPPNDPVVMNVGPTPAIIGDDIESDLDVEWAGALATAATVNFYTSAGSLFDGGVDTSALTAVDTNVPDIISLSYGGCELSNGAAGTAYWNVLWQQAAAQGQTVFVSTGDANATGCASSSAALATGATAGSYGVNALGSSAYNVAVGGSEFNEGTALGVTPFWGPGGTAPFGTALSYIPETVWNEGSFAIVIPGAGVAGGGGGVSMFTGRPAWQVGPGITAADPAGPTFTTTGAIPATSLHRLVPDLSLIAAGGHDGTIFCSEGVCKINADGSVGGIGVVGGTSVATPTMAGVQALINQVNGGRQGNANYYYYKLAAAQTTAKCASTLPPASSCNFNDIVSGNNYSPKTATGKYIFPVAPATTGTIQGVLGTDYIGFPALTGYDEASGLGTPNIANLATNWASVTFNASKTALTLSPVTTTHGTAITAVITVAAGSGTGTPTGGVSITAVGQPAGAGDGNVYTLVGGKVTVTLLSLPGGSYNVVAHYAGDSVYGSSDSAPVAVTIAKEPSVMILQPYNISAAGAVTVPATFTYGTSIYVDTELAGLSATGSTPNGGAPNTGAPTGSVNYTVTSGTTTFPSVTEPLDTYGTTYLEISQAFPNFLISINYPVVLSPAAYTIAAAYPGDNSFGATSGTTKLTVSKATVRPTIAAGAVEVASASLTGFNVTIGVSGGGTLPTGTMTLLDTTTGATLGSGTLANGAVVVTTTGIVTSGPHVVTASYGGDVNYNAAVSLPVTVTVGGSASSVTLVATPAAAKVLATVSLVATVPAGTTGTISFVDGTVVLGAAAINPTTNLATLNIATLGAATHTITAAYGGSATLSSSSSAPVTVVIAQNTPTVVLTSQQANVGNATVSMNAVLTLVPAGPATAAGANPAPTPTMQFLDGATLLGTGTIMHTLNYGYYTAAFTTPALKPGVHTLTAKYPGDVNYAGATSGTQTVNIGLTTLNVTSSTTNVGTGIPFTLTGYVTPVVATTTAITGTVTFYDGAPVTGTVIGTATVSANGVATLATAKLTTVATHTITAVYSGDANFYTSTFSTGVNVVAVTPGFTIAVNPTALTIAQGSAGSVVVTATSYGNYSGIGAMSCLGLPVTAVCTFIYPTIDPTPVLTFTGVNGNQTSALTITTFGPSGPNVRPTGFLWLPALLLAGLLGLRRRQLSMRGRQLMVLAILLCGAMATSGCSSNNTPSTPKGTYTVTVIANGVGSTTASPSIQPTATIALTVQ